MAQYAWVLLVMSNEEYFMGAIVCAKSLKAQNTIYPIILMVGNDLLEYLETHIELLLTIFDDITIVPIIEHPTIALSSKHQQEIYKNWISKSFTKWSCLALCPDGGLKSLAFDKVILLDADLVFISNCDELFELTAPAGCFSQPWASPYHKNGSYNPYIKSNKRWQLNKDIPHGETINSDLIMSALTNTSHSKNKTFAVSGFMVLLQPNMEDYNLLLEIIYSSPIYGKNTKINETTINIQSISGSDETAISLLYAHRGINFTHIHQKYAAVLWKEEWVPASEARAIHYFGKTKPWNMNIDEYPDLKIWWDFANSLDENFKKIFNPEYEPNLLDIAVAEYELVKDVQKMIVNYLTPINKQTPEQKINKQELWERAKLFTAQFFKNASSNTSSNITYPLWKQFLETEYNYEKFNIAKIFFNKWLAEIKIFVANRIKINPRQIKITILENEIICGAHIKINKNRKYISALEKNEDIIPLLISQINEMIY